MEGEKITGSCSSENELNDCSGDGISLSQNGRGNMLLDYSADRVVLEEGSGGAIYTLLMGRMVVSSHN